MAGAPAAAAMPGTRTSDPLEPRPMQPTAPIETPVPMPKTIGRFTILNEIGRGSYGVVWAAQDPVLAREIERRLITRALQETGGNRTHAARLLEISHPSLLSKIKVYGIPL